MSWTCSKCGNKNPSELIKCVCDYELDEDNESISTSGIDSRADNQQPENRAKTESITLLDILKGIVFCFGLVILYYIFLPFWPIIITIPIIASIYYLIKYLITGKREKQTFPILKRVAAFLAILLALFLIIFPIIRLIFPFGHIPKFLITTHWILFIIYYAGVIGPLHGLSRAGVGGVSPNRILNKFLKEFNKGKDA